jgi:hypothetical protein
LLGDPDRLYSLPTHGKGEENTSMKTALLKRNSIELAERLIDRWFYGEEETESVERFLSDSIDLKYQREVNDEEALRIRTEQNQFIQFLLKYIDAHPLAVRDGHASSIRRAVWKYSGVNCDDFTKLDIRTGVRFDNPEGGDLANFNPANITILTGGKKVFITGLRGDTYLDGSGRIIIFGSFNCASAVGIFTHDHEFRAPDKILFEQGRSFSDTIVYPECFLGENTFVFGNLNFRNVVAPKSVTRLRVTPQPYAIVGGVGSSYGVKKVLEAPETFPPAFLKESVRNVKKYSKKYGAHLEKYVEILGEFLRTDRKNWEPYQARIAAAEADLLKQD